MSVLFSQLGIEDLDKLDVLRENTLEMLRWVCVPCVSVGGGAAGVLWPDVPTG